MAKTLIGIKPLHERILIGIYDDGDTTIKLGGKTFFLLDDSSATKDRDIHVKHQGVRSRWAIVLAVSDTVDEYGYISVGDKVLLDQLTWSRGIFAPIDGSSRKVWSIPSEDVLLVGGSDNFTDTDKVQIKRLYPNWESWSEKEM
jgi:hypothetical protein